MSNTKIAKIRDGMHPKELCEEGDEQKENRDASSSNKPKHSKRKGKETYDREEPGVEGRKEGMAWVLDINCMTQS